MFQGISISQSGQFRQVEKSDNRFWMFDLGCPRKDNNRWSVRMKSLSFRTARPRVPHRVPRLVAGFVMLGLTLSASAKDEFVPGAAAGSSAKVGAVPIAKAGAAVVAKPIAAKTPVAAKKRPWFQVGTASWYGLQF